MMKKYMDIIRLGHRSTVGVLNEGDMIIVQEKIDGANASFAKEDGILKCFSRRTELNEHETLRGFYNWAKEYISAEYLLDDAIYFGEWLISHKVQYREDALRSFYLFDIYDKKTEKYLPFELVQHEANRLRINLINVMYQGEYKGFEHLQSFVGKSAYGETGEGIVVKRPDYINKYGNQIFVKLVADDFREIQKQKAPKDPNAPDSSEMVFVKTFVTSGRVEKFLYKFVDEGILDESFGIEDMGTILKNMSPRIYEDLMKEESDSLPEGYDDKLLRKSINKVVAVTTKAIISQRGAR